MGWNGVVPKKINEMIISQLRIRFRAWLELTLSIGRVERRLFVGSVLRATIERLSVELKAQSLRPLLPPSHVDDSELSQFHA